MDRSTNNEGAKKSPKIIDIVSYALKMGANGCHTCICSLFQVIKHISTGLYQLYVYELASTCPPKKNVVQLY